jgi:hypothetical protein
MWEEKRISEFNRLHPSECLIVTISLEPLDSTCICHTPSTEQVPFQIPPPEGIATPIAGVMVSSPMVLWMIVHSNSTQKKFLADLYSDVI